MTDYMQTLMSICFTVITADIVVASLGGIVFALLLLWNMVQELFD